MFIEPVATNPKGQTENWRKAWLRTVVTDPAPHALLSLEPSQFLCIALSPETLPFWFEQIGRWVWVDLEQACIAPSDT